MARGFNEYLLTLFGQIGGGRGGLENDLVRFALGIVLWSILLVFALKRRHEEQSPNETLLAWGFAIGLAREAFMFTLVSLGVSGALPLAVLRPFFPPFESALSLAAVVTVTAAYLRYVFGTASGGRVFLPVGAVVTGGLYLLTAIPWARHAVAFPADAFGRTGYDAAFRIAGLALLGWAIVILRRARGWIRTVLLAAASCFFIAELLMLFAFASRGAWVEIYAPISHVAHLAGIATLAYVYLRELSDERLQVVAHLQTVLHLTEVERLRTEAIFDAVGDAISVQDRGFRVIYQNRVHRNEFGDQAGRLCHEAYASSPTPCPGCPLELAFADEGIHRVERRRYADEAGVSHVEVTASCLRDGEGGIVAGIEVARDITARVAAETALRGAKAELEWQNAELRKLDRMKDGLIRDVTHEFKTPVAKHAMQLELLRGLLRERGLEQECGRVLTVMDSTLARQQKMIRNILDLARLEAGARRYCLGPVRLDEVAAEVVEDRAYALEAHAVVLRLDVPELVLASDREMLRCLLSNLVDNAIKYRSTERPPHIEIGARTRGGRVVIAVEDNGIGFAPEDRDRAFERFWQASASAEGSGVGLSICLMIAQDLGGSIAIASEGKNRGTTVTIDLPWQPCVQAEQAEPQYAPPPAAPGILPETRPMGPEPGPPQVQS